MTPPRRPWLVRALARAVVLACVGVPTAATGIGQAATSFSTGGFTTAPYGTAVAVGDLNLDGKLDLALTNETLSGRLFTTRGDGAGHFAVGPVANVGFNPLSVALADFNGDGKLDAVVANASSGSIELEFGNGDGTVSPPPFFGVYGGFSEPYAVAVGDFNGDGTPDVAVVDKAGGSASQGSVAVLLGNRDGSLQPPHAYAVGAAPASVAVGDFNGDGKTDLVIASNANNTLSVLLGNGDGTLAAPRTLPVGAGPSAVTVGDFNGDGKLDLAETNVRSGTLSVLLGNGDGTFQPPRSYAVGKGPNAVVVGDINGDGHPDLVVDNGTSSNVSVLLGNGAGTFQAQQTFAVGASPSAVGIGDFTGDGKPDLVTTGYRAFGETTLLNTSNPFSSAALRVSSSTARAGSVLIEQLRLAGPAGSGRTPAADQFVQLYNPAAGPVSVGGWELQGSKGGFTTLPQGTVIAGHGQMLLKGVAAADSLSSILASSGELPSGRFLEAPGGGVRLVAPGGSVSDSVGFSGAPTGFFSGTRLSLPSALPSGQFAWVRDYANGTPVNTRNNHADFSFVATNDNDSAHGSPVLGAPGLVNLTSYLPRGDILQAGPVDPAAAATAAPNQIFTTGSGGSGATLILNRTITNCSGHASDSACAGSSGAPAIVTGLRFRITGLSTLNSPGVGSGQTVLMGDSSTGESGLPGARSCVGSTSVQALPVDAPSTSGSAGLDSTWTVPASELPAGGLASGECINVEFEFKAAGSGPFTFTFNAEASTTPAQLFHTRAYATGRGPGSVSSGDLNGDGVPDVAVANLYDNTISVLLGVGDGTFRPQQTYAVGNGPEGVHVADLNGDGCPDLVVANSNGTTVSVLLNRCDGSGTFEPSVTDTVGNAPYSVAVADLNGDGKPDLVTTNSNDATVSVLLGNGDGSFQAQQTYAVGTTPLSVAAIDFNGDGKPDLAVANARGNTVSVLLGNGDGSFRPQQTFAVGAFPYSLAVGDFNHDGKSDLAVDNDVGNTVSVLLGNGDGTFQPQRTFAVGRGSTSVRVADLNGDGVSDLAVANGTDNTISVLYGNADGSFQPQLTYGVPSDPSAVAVADFNLDKRADIAVPNFNANTVSLLLSQR